MKKQKLFKSLLTHIGLLTLSAFSLFPFIWMGLTSFKDKTEIYKSPVIWIPKSFSFVNYLDLIDLKFYRYFINSMLVAGVVMLIVVFLSLLAGYGFSRFNFRGRVIFFSSSLMGQLLPTSVMFLPLFMFLGRFFLDSPLSLVIIYTAILLPFATWTMTGYLQGISRILDDAAMIDGCNRIQTLFRVLLPPAMPGIVSVALYAFIVAWQEFLFATLFINSIEKRTLPLALVAFRGQYEINWGSMMAGSLITTLPLTIIFVIFQRSLVTGLTGGAVKE